MSLWLLLSQIPLSLHCRNTSITFQCILLELQNTKTNALDVSEIYTERSGICYIYIHINLLTLRSLTLYIYGAPILDVSRSHTTTQHSR